MAPKTTGTRLCPIVALVTEDQLKSIDEATRILEAIPEAHNLPNGWTLQMVAAGRLMIGEMKDG